MKHFKFLIILVLSALMSGCGKDPDTNSTQGNTIKLYMSDMSDVMTRSIATENERWISDAYLLVFGTDGKYKTGEAISVSNITDNGEQRPKISTQLVLENGDNIVVLCNTGVASMPSFVEGTSTTADINSNFPSVGWNLNQDGSASGKGMPMSGNVVWNNTTKPEVQMYRSVAKIQLVLAIPSGADLSHSFSTDVDAVKWGMYNYVKDGDVYSVNGAMSTPASSAFANSTALTQRVVGATAAALNQLTYYMPEYPNATMAKTTAVSPSVFSADRTCLIVQTTAGYYRIDLATGNEMDETKAFLDIKRNYHYQVKITKVNSNGYLSVEEALQNPGSNLEYEVIVSGNYDNYTTSNGQYAISADKDEVVLLDGIHDDAFNFSFIITDDEDAFSITTATLEIVDADRNKIAMPEYFSVVKAGVAGALAVTNDIVNLGSLTDNTQFSLKAVVAPEMLRSLGSIAGCFIHITIGNIQRYIPITISPDVDITKVVYYAGTVNCYEVASGSASTHTIDITPYLSNSYNYENIKSSDLVTPKSARMLWSDVSSSHISAATVTHNGGDYSLTYTTDGAAGNAVIAIYDNEDPEAADAKILWSYHIWVSDRTDESNQTWGVVNTTNHTHVSDKYVMMGRNLGATSSNIATDTDNSAYGLMYQWGRKDPFVGSANTTGNVDHVIYSTSGTTSITRVATSATVGTILYAVQHPLTFITTSNDWLYVFEDSFQSLWGNANPSTTQNYYPRPFGTKSIYDPCPEGYHVPPQDAFSGSVLSANLLTASQGWVGSGVSSWDLTEQVANHITTNRGIQFYCNGEQTGPIAYLPAEGTRNYNSNGNLDNNAGKTLFYWTNSPVSKTSKQSTRASYNSTTFNAMWNSYRGLPASMRCVKII